MGNIPVKDTHGKRSSSMTFAMRWRHGNLRLIMLSIIISIAMSFMFLVLLYGATEKNVSVVVNGQETVVTTKQWVLQRLLDEQAITVGPHDKISASLNAPIKDGDIIEVNHAMPITVVADGNTSTVYTTEKTVQAAIEDLDISIRSQDEIDPPLASSIEENETITVVRVETKVTSNEKTVPFSIVKKEDASLVKGTEKVVQSGQEGVVVEQLEARYEDGVLVSNSVISETVKTNTVDQVVAVGAAKPKSTVTTLSNSSSSVEQVTKGDYTFNAKKVLTNVTLTAYTAGAESTGKSEGDAGYGVTASGTTVEEGRTIAVDTSVIPMGWWVYIEGVGLRRAEDKGGAIKGNKIDVYFESLNVATKFGKKKGVKVYVIGPNKPSAS
ncbi:MAG: G5 domain-containing protein [Candidatus Pristimantibacillus lignocellulolyticus]|uniref:G5 domain-containing protein n=1 Tax=Candidatus Pristimantibacillus lignocellulolyticus TaxID=2994561 RepID=A0A9J6ZIE3_9BACL|nr:MAG: G5 domain-containing protein [Candidatus Pristimantibacillus lignocellulolyticus]